MRVNIRNYSPEASNIHRREAELNIVLAKVNKFDIKHKMAWNINFIPPVPNKIKVDQC